MSLSGLKRFVEPNQSWSSALAHPEADIVSIQWNITKIGSQFPLVTNPTAARPATVHDPSIASPHGDL
jgi:hypothetical protein